MAGDWIKMRGNLWDDPRIGRICDMTGCREATAIGALYWLWATADQHTEDGCMPGLSMQQIDRKTGVKGFAAALVDVGWLVDDAQGVVIQHFEEHNGASAKKRAQTSKRVASLRSSNAGETPEDENGNAPSVTHALAREEKRREEVKDIPPSAAPPEKPTTPKKPRKTAMPDGFERFENLTPRLVAWAKEKGFGQRYMSAQLEAFVSYVKRSGQQYVDWDEALMTAARENWAKLPVANAGGVSEHLKGGI